MALKQTKITKPAKLTILTSCDYQELPSEPNKNSIVKSFSTIVEKARLRSLKDIFGIIVICLAILGGSSIGALSNFIPVRSPFAKNAWRSGLNATIFMVPAYIEYRVKRSSINYR